MSDSIENQVIALFSGKPELVADPWPIFRRLQNTAPVLRTDHYLVLSRYSDIKAVLTDQRSIVEFSYADALLAGASEEDRPLARELLDFFARWLAQANGDEHDRLRRLVHTAFTPRTVRELQPMIAHSIDALLAELPEDETVDLVSELAFQLPIIVICRMLDIPIEDRFRIHANAEEFMKFIVGKPVIRESHAAMLDLQQHIGEVIESRRGRPTTPLLQALFDAEADGRRLSTDDLVMLTVNLIFGGHDTTTNVIGNGLLELMNHPEQWQALIERPELCANATEELLRYATPVPEVHRGYHEDVEVNGIEIAKGEHIRLLLGAANRDPAVYAEPDRLDVRRERVRHLTFGEGPHYCLGQALTRLEVTMLLQEVTARFPRMALAGTPVWKPFYALRGLQSLPVTLGP